MIPQASKMNSGRWWWLLAASFAIGLVALAPAALMERALSSTANVQRQFVADAGTVWTGRGRLIVAADSAPMVIPIAWRFDPLSLLRLRLGFFVEANSPALAGTAHVGLGLRSVDLSNTAVNADVRLLSMTHVAAGLLAPTGRVRLQQLSGERFIVQPASSDKESWRVDGVMGLNAEQLAFGGFINAPVGSHELKLRGDGTTINVSILRSSGPLTLEGTGNIALTAPRRLTFSGFATTTVDAPATLKQLGPVMADGRQRIELNTTW